MSNLQERLATAFPEPRRRGLFAEIARVCGVSSPTVTAWFNKPDKVASIERANAEKICRAFSLDISPEWLAEGTGPFRQAGTRPGHGDNPTIFPSEPKIQLETTDVVIPQFETGGSMGRGIVLNEQPGVIKEWRVSEQWAQQNIHRVTSLKNLAIVTGFGPSMQPLFNPGDPLLVDRGVGRADVDGIYFFRVGDEGFVKQLQRIPTEKGLVLRAKSYNQLYDSFDITAGMDFEVFARVVKVWKGEEF